ncbi:MAG: hypothetical protein ACF8XB_03640 [Planctomycetota bacterium JB042]
MIPGPLVALLLRAAPGDRSDAPLVPAPWIVARDPRPLDEQKRTMIREALDLETAALAKQAEHPAAKPENVAADLRRVDAMRTLVERRIDPDRLSPRTLPLATKYLVRFALDRLEAEGADAEAVETWTEANRRFLDGGGPGDREAALRARFEALRSMTGAALLRRFLIAVEDGTLDAAARAGFAEAMQKEFPDAAVPGSAPPSGLPFVPGGASPSPAAAAGVGGAAPDATNPFSRLSRFPRQPGSETLPRLDGVERPLGEVESLAELLAKMRAS